MSQLKKRSIRSTKTPMLRLKKSSPAAKWSVTQNDDEELASPLDKSTVIECIPGLKQTQLSFSVRRKPGRPPSKKSTIDENIEGKSSPLTPKRKLFDGASDCSPSKKNCSPNEKQKTPSSLLRKLNLSDPQEGGLKPKSLFGPSGSGYSLARQALHVSQPESLPGREVHFETLIDFLQNRLQDSKDAKGSIYISGAPGTGKTATVNMALSNAKVQTGFKSAYINCTAVKSARAIFNKIAEEFKIPVQGSTEKLCSSSIQNYITKSKKKMLLILDEIDQLECRHQTVLYTLFEWPCLQNSQLTLMGIANSLDLTDRLLPRLQARISYKPQLLHYAPYTKQQISDIINSRLEQAGACQVFKSIAVEMLAAKVASVSGDARKALDIGRRVVDLVDPACVSKELILRQTTDHGSNSPSKSRNSPSKKCDPVGIAEVKNVLDGVYGTSQTLVANSEGDGLPMQQKLLICSLLLMLRKGNSKEVTVGKLHEIYSRVCSKRNMNSVSQSEFLSMCSLIETRGIINLAFAKKESRLSKITLQWDDDEVSAALCDKFLLSSILNDVSCLQRK